MLFVPRPDKATQHDCVHTWHNDCTPTRTDGRVARVDERKELVPASDCPVVVFQQNICATTNFLLLPPPKNSLGQASTFVVGKPFFILFYMWKEGRAREPPILFVTWHHSKHSVRVLVAPSIHPMPACLIVGGCKFPQLAGGSHVCQFCGDLVHSLCLQNLTGVEDQPKDGFVCGSHEQCRRTAVGSSAASAVEANPPGCAAGSRCTRAGKDQPTVRKTCCNKLAHLMCARHPCEGCEEEEDQGGFDPGETGDDTLLVEAIRRPHERKMHGCRYSCLVYNLPELFNLSTLAVRGIITYPDLLSDLLST